MTDSPATTAFYDRIGLNYAPKRRPDPRLARELHAALGPVTSVVNVGAGAGSYEPTDRMVIAVEPSQTMLGQRPPGSAPAIQGVAEKLPLAGGSFDAGMAVFTIHHWRDLEAGLSELMRVARKRLVLLTMDAGVLADHWFVTDYAPEVLDVHLSAFPTLERLTSLLPGAAVSSWEVPADCSDLFHAALWARPELHLDPAVRAASSVWHQMSADVVERAIGSLRADLESGRWDQRHGELRSRLALDVGVRVVTVDL
jgi:SAM-dependent methyltransferase